MKPEPVSTALRALFTAADSQAYRAFRDETDRRRLVFAIRYGALLYASFGLLDWLAYPDRLTELLALRVAFVVPVLSLSYVMPQPRVSMIWVRRIAHVAVFVSGVVIGVMTAVTDGFGSTYYVGIIVVMVCFVSLEIAPPRQTLLYTLGMAACYAVLDGGLRPETFAHNHAEGVQAIFYLIGASLMTAAGSAVLELQRRTTFNANVELAAKNEALEEARRHQGEFLRTVSHEMRTPLSSILGYAELLRDKESLSERGHGRLVRIEQSASRQLRLVNDLLDMARIEAGRGELDPTTFAVGPVLEDVVEETRPLLGERGVRLEVDAPPGLSIFADELRVRQVLLNLTGNAAKFTFEGSIVLSARVDGDGLCLAVRDTGIGIEPDKQEEIFRAFRQTADGVKAGGTGLGLGIVTELVRLMGGRVALDSAVGAGSTFEVHLPKAVVRVADDASADRAGAQDGR